MTLATFLDRFRRPRPPFRPLHPGEHSESPLLPLLTPIRPTPRRQLHPALPDDHSYSPPPPSQPSLSDVSSSPDRPARDPTRTVHFAASDAQLPRTLTPVSPTSLPTDPALLRHHLLRLLSERTECLRIIDLSQSLPDQPTPPTTVDTSVSLPARLERALHLLTTEASQLQRRLADMAAERDTLRMQLSAARRATPHKPYTPNASFLSSDSHAPTNSRAQSRSKSNSNPIKPRSHSIDIPAPQQPTLPQRRTAVPVRTLRFSRDDSALQSQLSTLRQQRQRDRAEISDLLAQLRTVRQALDRQQHIQHDRQQQETRAHSSRERSHVSAHRDASPERATESDGLKRRLSAAQKERARVERERDAVRQLLAGTLSDKAMLSTRVQTLLDALASRADAAKRAEQMLARHTAASDAALRAARSQLERVRGDASSLQSRVDEWRRDVSDRDARQRDEVFRLRQHGEELQKRVLALRDVGGSMSATEGTEVEGEEFEDVDVDVVCGVDLDCDLDDLGELVTEEEHDAPANIVELSEDLLVDTADRKEAQTGDIVLAQISRGTDVEWTATLGEKLDDGTVVPYLGFRRMRIRSLGSESRDGDSIEHVQTEVSQEELENVLVHGLVTLTERMGAAAVKGIVLPEEKAGRDAGSQVVDMFIRQASVTEILKKAVEGGDLEGQGLVEISFRRVGYRAAVDVGFELVAFRPENPEQTPLHSREECS